MMNDYPNIIQSIGLLIAVSLLIFALSVVGGIAAAILESPFADDPGALAIVNLIAIGLALLWAFRKTGAPFAEVFPLTPATMSFLFPMALTLVGGAVLLSEADNLFRTVLPMPPWLAEVFLRLYGEGTSRWGSILALVIVAPLSEELLFRGLILRGFLRQYSVRKAIIVSAVLFGFFHLNPWQFLGASVLGMLFAWSFVRTASLIPCLFGHALYNAVPLVAMDILHLQVQGFTSGFSSGGLQPLWFDLVGLFLAGLGVSLLVRTFRASSSAGS